jgi:hypothetical protein
MTRKTAPACKARHLPAEKRTSKVPQVIDGASGKPLTPYRCRLESLRDCKRELARVYRKMMAGTIEPQLAGRAGFLLGIIARIVADSDIENRILALEKHANELETRTSGSNRRNA